MQVKSVATESTWLRLCETVVKKQIMTVDVTVFYQLENIVFGNICDVVEGTIVDIGIKATVGLTYFTS